MDRFIMTSNSTKNSSTRQINNALGGNDGHFIVHRENSKRRVSSSEVDLVPNSGGEAKITKAEITSFKPLVAPLSSSAPLPLLPSESVCSTTAEELEKSNLVAELEDSRKGEEMALRRVKELESMLRSLAHEKDEIWADAMLVSDDNDALTKELKDSKSENKKLKKEIKWLHQKLEDAQISITKQEQKIQEQDEVICNSWHGGIRNGSMHGVSLSNHERQWTSLHGGEPGSYGGVGEGRGGSQKGEEQPWERTSVTSSSLCSLSFHEPHSEGAIVSLKKKMNRRISAVKEEKAQIEKKMDMLLQQKGREIEVATEMARAASHRSLALQRIMKDCPSCWSKSDMFLPDQPSSVSEPPTEKEEHVSISREHTGTSREHTSTSKGKCSGSNSASGPATKEERSHHSILDSDVDDLLCSSSIDTSHRSDNASSFGHRWPTPVENDNALLPAMSDPPDKTEAAQSEKKVRNREKGRAEEEQEANHRSRSTNSSGPLHDIDEIAYTSSTHLPVPATPPKQGPLIRARFARGIQAKLGLSGLRRKRASGRRNAGHQCETIIEASQQYDDGATPSVTSSVTFPSSLVSGKNSDKKSTRGSVNNKSVKKIDNGNSTAMMRNSWHGGIKGRKLLAMSISASEQQDQSSFHAGRGGEAKESKRADRKSANGTAASVSNINSRSLSNCKSGEMRNTWHGKRSTGGEKIRALLFAKQSSGSPHDRDEP